jgi:phage-related protein
MSDPVSADFPAQPLAPSWPPAFHSPSPLPLPVSLPVQPPWESLRTMKWLPVPLVASGLIFDWCVTSASYDLEPSVIKAQFGDGYAQRRPAGINTQARMWTVDIKNVIAQTANDVLAFVKARNGVEVFSWTPPRSTEAENVICSSWNFAYGDMIEDGSLLYSITMKFEEAFV